VVGSSAASEGAALTLAGVRADGVGAAADTLAAVAAWAVCAGVGSAVALKAGGAAPGAVEAVAPDTGGAAERDESRTGAVPLLFARSSSGRMSGWPAPSPAGCANATSAPVEGSVVPGPTESDWLVSPVAFVEAPVAFVDAVAAAFGLATAEASATAAGGGGDDMRAAGVAADRVAGTGVRDSSVPLAGV
jgi:hypothetical protein